MVTQVVYSQEFEKHKTIGHPENPKRLTEIIAALQQSSLYTKLQHIQPTLVSESLLYEIHSVEMIEQVKSYSKEESAWIDLDTYVSKNDYHTARLAVGGVVDLCNNVDSGKAQNGFALVRPPGHHATKHRSMGFCLFNNPALAAHAMTKKNKKILIIDIDGHHGNGVQQIFFTRNDVLYQSLHLSPHFPGTGDINEIGIGEGTGFTNNAPLSFRDGNTVATEILTQVFLPIAKQFHPDMTIMCVGYDSHHADPLGGLAYTCQFYADAFNFYEKIQPKIVCTLEGGYNLKWVGPCFCVQIAQMLHQPFSLVDHAIENKHSDRIITMLKRELGEYWIL